ncbi:MAG: hypothetical protein A2Y61_08280 [Chloroflexi bacterium RBG_13_60_13]|nr:MAG: hypothetical protein A2Y61_08280 [Chloroflexi bacterium RBG_13_60_13]
MASLEQDFHHAMVAIYETQKDYGYFATYFKQMLDQYGGVEAAKRLLAGREVQQGLMKLWELGHLDNSVEAHVILAKYRPLFTEAEVEEARRRLEALGYLTAPREG